MAISYFRTPLRIYNILQAEDFNFIEAGAGNSSELMHAYVILSPYCPVRLWPFNLIYTRL